MLLLHTELSDRFVDALRGRLSSITPAVELAPLDEEVVGVSAPALLVGASLSSGELAAALRAGVVWLQTVTVGLEDILSAELVASDVEVTTTGGTSARSMAEFVMARMLEHAKQLRLLAAQQEERRWKAVWAGDLDHTTLVVVGLGPIGRAVATLGKAFDMHVVGVRRRPEAGAGPCDEVVGVDGLSGALAAADYVVLAPALTPSTRGLVGATELAAMKDGALLVNVGRGDLVDEAALLGELRSSRIAAALDVTAEEPLSADSPLWAAPNVTISPHCSSLTANLFDHLVDVIADNVERFATGRELRNAVDKAAGYPLR